MFDIRRTVCRYAPDISREEAISVFEAYGLYARHGNARSRAHLVVTGAMDVRGAVELVAIFSPYGVIYVRYDASGRYELIADFGVFGVYVKYNNGAWTRIHTSNPEFQLLSKVIRTVTGSK